MLLLYWSILKFYVVFKAIITIEQIT
jgi:hypothetical protein